MPGPRINLIRPDGKVVSVTRGDAELLIGLGYRPETPEEADVKVAQAQRAEDYGGIGQGVIAAGEGLVSGLLPGSDYLMADEATRARAELHPTARFFGELAGNLVPVLGQENALLGKLPGAVISKGTTRGAEAVLGKGLASKVVGGAAEGALWGGASEVTASSLSGDPLTAEGILAGMGLGAAFGGGANVLAHGFERAALAARAGETAGSAEVRQLARDFTPNSHAGDLPTPGFSATGAYDSIHPTSGLVDTSGVVSGGADIPYTGGGFGVADDAQRRVRSSYDVHPRVDTPVRLEPSVIPEATTGVHAQEQVADSLIPPEKWQRFRTTAKEIHAEAKRLSDEVALTHDVALREAKYAQAKRGERFKAYADEVMGAAALNPADREGVRIGELGGSRDEAIRVFGRDAQAAGTPLGLQKEVRARYKKYAAAVADSRDGVLIKETQKAWEESVGKLAEQQGFAPFTEPGIVSEEAVKRVDDVHKLMFATRELDEILATPTNRHALALFSQRASTTEKLRAAVEWVMSSKLPEAVPHQEALARLIDDMVEGAGLSHPGSPAAKLQALGDLGNGTITKAAHDFNARQAAGPSSRYQGKAGSVDSWSRPSAKGPSSASPKPSPVVDDTVAIGGDPIESWDPAVDAPKASDKGKTLGDKVASMARREAAYKAAAAVTGQTRGNSMRRMLQYGLVSFFLGAKATAIQAVKDNAIKLARFGGPVAKGLRVAGPRAFSLANSAMGHEDTEADIRKRFVARSAELRGMQGVAKDQVFAFAQQLAAAGHSDFAFAMYGAATKASEAIVERVPKDPPGTRWGTEYIWDAPPEQVAVFAQEYAAAYTPLEFLSAVAEDPEGIHPSAVETFSNAWPQLYASFRAEALNEIMMTGTKGMPRSRLQALSLILDVPFDPTLDAQFVAAQQAMFMERPQTAEPPKGNGGGGGSGQPGRPPGADMTQLQRLQTR